MNELIYNLAIWLDDTEWSRMLHESYYMYNWVESTHVLTLMVSLGILFLIDLRMFSMQCCMPTALKRPARRW